MSTEIFNEAFALSVLSPGIHVFKCKNEDFIAVSGLILPAPVALVVLIQVVFGQNTLYQERFNENKELFSKIKDCNPRLVALHNQGNSWLRHIQGHLRKSLEKWQVSDIIDLCDNLVGLNS